MANNPHTFRQGERVNLGALFLERVTHYERKAWHGEDTSTCYRYQFRAPTNDLIVYSGKYLALKAGTYVDMRATIKKVDSDWNCVRLARVKVLAKYDVRERGLL